jgi:transcription antitermination factor NusG
MNIQEINRAIISGTFTAQELESIQDAVKFARAKTARVNSVTFHAGDTVKITHAKLGGTVVGTIRKIKIKKADVFIPGKNVTYNVPLSMLEAV